MKSLIRSWESWLFSALFYAYFLLVHWSFRNNLPLQQNDILSPQLYRFLVFVYLGIWVYYISIFAQEYLLYKRINSEPYRKLYTPKKSLFIFRIIIMVICHIICWFVFYSWNYYIWMPLVIIIAAFAPPKVIEPSIYETDHYIICSGYKIYFNDIESFRDEFGYKIDLIIKGKPFTLKCGNGKKYDIVLKRLEYWLNSRENTVLK
ncbi:hypothetical protein EDC18_101458 [Natranaerovirga pectinivora]|uniref:Uncharacterized protein n=1 Tax=Natranaerovirga pectinivora TaxID=682400 RepID=A0A4R3MTW3_9FIRM|nr:hypothetical protein [Natranaerovirga pectinivora]TCT17160.1 hypothetical protein EDC18_101458 [Natranaerovirga pectinivora]